jgi:hypothetical protein
MGPPIDGLDLSNGLILHNLLFRNHIHAKLRFSHMPFLVEFHPFIEGIEH